MEPQSNKTATTNSSAYRFGSVTLARQPRWLRRLLLKIVWAS